MRTRPSTKYLTGTCPKLLLRVLPQRRWACARSLAFWYLESVTRTELIHRRLRGIARTVCGVTRYCRGELLKIKPPQQLQNSRVISGALKVGADGHAEPSALNEQSRDAVPGSMFIGRRDCRSNGAPRLCTRSSRGHYPRATGSRRTVKRLAQYPDRQLRL